MGLLLRLSPPLAPNPTSGTKRAAMTAAVAIAAAAVVAATKAVTMTTLVRIVRRRVEARRMRLNLPPPHRLLRGTRKKTEAARGAWRCRRRRLERKTERKVEMRKGRTVKTRRKGKSATRRRKAANLSNHRAKLENP